MNSPENIMHYILMLSSPELNWLKDKDKFIFKNAYLFVMPEV